MFRVVRQCFCFLCADMPHFSENTFVHTWPKEGRLSPSVSVRLSAQPSCVSCLLTWHFLSAAQAEQSLSCALSRWCRRGGASGRLCLSSCVCQGCLLWNLRGAQVTGTPELMGSQLSCTPAFCAAPGWGLREVLAEELGCFSWQNSAQELSCGCRSALAAQQHVCLHLVPVSDHIVLTSLGSLRDLSTCCCASLPPHNK